MKISKKIFACVLTVCMLLTMFAGVLSASAAVAGSATIGSVEIAAGAAAEVPVTLTADAAIGGADLYIAFPEEVTVSAAVETAGYSLEYNVDGVMAAEGNVDIVDGVAHFVLLASDDAFTGAATVEIDLTIAGLAEGEYVVAFADGTLIGTVAEVEVAAELVDGAITVNAAEEVCLHTETKEVVTKAATCEEAGTKNIVCEACDVVVTPDAVIPALGHAWGEGVETTAPDCENAGVMTYTCTNDPAHTKTEAIEAKGHTASETLVDNKDGTHSEVCGVCDAVLSTEDHTYDATTHECACGAYEAQYDKNLKFTARAASIQDSLGISYIIMNTAYSKYHHIVVEATPEEYDNNRNLKPEKKTYELPLDTSAPGMTAALYTGIPLFALDLSVDTVIKAYDANGRFVAYSQTYTDTPYSLVANTYNGKTTTEALKRVITDMLNLGTAAQAHFKKAGSDLETAYTTKPINDGWDQTYASEEVDLSGLTTPDSVYADNAPLTKANITIAPSLSMSATPTASYTITDVKGNIDTADLKLKLSYVSVYPKGKAGLKEEYAVISDIPGTKMSVASFSLLTLADTDQVITAELYYQDQLVVTQEFTVEQGISKLLSGNSATIKAVAKELAKFGAAARAHFG